MRGFVTRLTRVIAHPVLALSGLLGALGVLPASAAQLPERAALEARVAEVRRHLTDPAARPSDENSDGQARLAQTGKWNNWPNWSNWANWRNG